MKTTIDIPDSLYKKAKILAIERGQTLKQVVLDSLEAELKTPKNSAKVAKEPKSYGANRKLLPDFARLQAAGAFRPKPGDRDISELISEDREDRPQNPDPKPWMKFTGCMAKDPELLAELKRIDKVIEDEFGHVDEGDWK